MEKFEKHMDLGEEIVLGDEKLLLKSLGTEYLIHLFKIEKAIAENQQKGSDGKIDFKQILGSFNDETIKSLVKLIDGTLEKSYPERWDDEQEREKLKSLGLRYRWILFPLIISINSSEGTDVESDKVDKLKSKLKEISN